MPSTYVGCKETKSNPFHFKTRLKRLYFNYFKERFVHFNGTVVFYYKEIQKEIFLIKFEHTRTFDVKTLLADIRKIGIDTSKLEEYMKKNKIKYEFTPVWIPDLEDTLIPLTYGGRRNRL